MLIGIPAQVGDVVGYRLGLDDMHTPLDTPNQGFFLVLAEIVAHFRTEQLANRPQMRGKILAVAIRTLVAVGDLQVLPVGDQSRRHFLHRQDVVDEARRCRAGRHAGHGHVVEARLRQGQPATFLDRAQASRTVAAGAGQHDANRAVTLVFRQ